MNPRLTNLPVRGGPFPVYMPLPVIDGAVGEAQNNIQAPRALVFFGALSAMAIALQGALDVRKPNGQCVPTSLMLLSIANSGERKSTVEGVFLEKIREFQAEKSSKGKERIAEWEVLQDIWKEKYKSILKVVRKKAAAGKCSKLEEEMLIKHQEAMPKAPGKIKILYEDATSEALFRGLFKDYPSAGLISSEGSGVINGRAFGDLSKQNAIWSGDTVTVDRVSAESYELADVRLTVSMMIQGKVFDDYIQRHGELSRGSGLWARFLICRPSSTQGSRFISNGVMSWEHRDKFWARLNELLEQNISLDHYPKREKKTIGFSAAASERWLWIFNYIESEIRLGGRFSGAGDHASKLAENIARVAALLHYFEFGDGAISLETLEVAISVCFWCSDEFLKVFIPPPQEETDAIELNAWLQLHRNSCQRYIPKNQIRQFGPGKLRDKQRLERALEILAGRGGVSIFRQGKTTVVDLFPGMMSGVVY